MYHRIINRDSLKTCAKEISQRNGTGIGTDGIPVKKATEHMDKIMDSLIAQLENGTYVPEAIKRVGIPKFNGGTRFIGIPTIADRVIQLSMVKVLDPILDKIFSNYSYGYRRNRNVKQCIEQAKVYLNSGYDIMIQLDLKNCFDMINHDKLMSELYRTIKDVQVLSLIRKYLRCKVIYEGKEFAKPEGLGTVQGGNISPLLANVYLNVLDKELSRRDIKFTRYADDCVIFCRSSSSAYAILHWTTRFIERDMMLEVNRNKTHVTTPKDCNMLGFKFRKEQGLYYSCVPKETVQKLRASIYEIVRKANSFEEAKKLIHDKITGWFAYFRNADVLSNRRMHYIDRTILEALYHKYPLGYDIKDYKDMLCKDSLNLSLVKLNQKLSDNE